MNDQPLVTVYIPTYNRVELLKRAVESVQAQTYKNLEIIIVDDCSQDDTAVYLKEISNLDYRISFHLKQKNSGACASRNIALHMAKGEYITGLDDDDLFLPDRVSKFIQATQKYNMDQTILFSGYLFQSSLRKNLKNKLRLFLTKKAVIQKDLLKNNYLGNQVFVKLQLLNDVNGFDESFTMWQDLECWYRLLKNKKAYLVPNNSYLVDDAHDYSRITSKKKLNAVYNKFYTKHNLNTTEKDYLKLHFYSYGVLNISLLLFIKRFIVSRNVRDFLIIVKFIKSKVKGFL